MLESGIAGTGGLRRAADGRHGKNRQYTMAILAWWHFLCSYAKPMVSRSSATHGACEAGARLHDADPDLPRRRFAARRLHPFDGTSRCWWRTPVAIDRIRGTVLELVIPRNSSAPSSETASVLRLSLLKWLLICY